MDFQEYLEKDSSGKPSLIYDSHIDSPGLISNYGKNLNEAVIKRDEIALKSLKYMINKVK